MSQVTPAGQPATDQQTQPGSSRRGWAAVRRVEAHVKVQSIESRSRGKNSGLVHFQQGVAGSALGPILLSSKSGAKRIEIYDFDFDSDFD